MDKRPDSPDDTWPTDSPLSTLRSIIALLDNDRRKIDGLGRAAASARRVHHYAQTHPIFSIASAAKSIGATFPTASNACELLRKLRVLREITGKQRHRLFAYGEYLDILNEGAEPIR